MERNEKLNWSAPINAKIILCIKSNENNKMSHFCYMQLHNYS